MPTSATSGIAQRCPPELIALILSHLASSLDSDKLSFSLVPEEPPAVQKISSSFYANLTACALVSHVWHDEAARLMYENVLLSEPGQIPHVIRHCQSQLARTRHVRIMWNRQPWMLPEDPDLSLIPVLLDLAPSLSYLTLGGEQFDLHSTALLDAFRRRSHPDSTSKPILGLSCCSLDTHYVEQRFGPQGRRTSRTISALLASCPHLVEGRFDEFRSAYSLSPVFASLSLHGNGTTPSYEGTEKGLTKLALKRVVLESNNLERLLCPLAGRLEELYLDRTSLSTCESWKSILHCVGQTLRVLVLRDCDFWATWERSYSLSLVDSVFASCPELREITLSGSLDSRTPALDRRHDKLEKLTISSRYLTDECVERALLGGIWPSLQMLDVRSACGWTLESRERIGLLCTSLGRTFV